MKRVEGIDWVHINCALFHDEYFVESFLKMEIKKTVSSEGIGEKRKGSPPTCELCLESHNLMNCNDIKCNKHAHIYCLLKSKLDVEITGKSWNLGIIFNEKIIEEIKQRDLGPYKYIPMQSDSILSEISSLIKATEDVGL
jgi:hypothetical protein